MDSNSQALTLHFETKTRVAGEALNGHVDINLALAQEDKIEQVRVELIGFIQTSITVGSGDSRRTYREKVMLIKLDGPLWIQGQNVSLLGTLRLLFQFNLPSGLPPSYYSSTGSTSGVIKYLIKVVGERPGFFRRNRRIHQLFPVLPAASQANIINKASLVGGWNQEWKLYNLESRIRKWPWGDYSYVYAELTIPALSSFPIFTFIPFRLMVITETKPLKRSEAPSPFTSKNEPLFPAPPTSPSQINLRLYSQLRVQASNCNRSYTTRVAHLGGMDDQPVLARLGDKFKTWSGEPEWVPQPGEKDDKDRGMWKRKTHFESFMIFTCPPSFETRTLGNQYRILLKIPFPGMGNDLESEFFITINSGVEPRRLVGPSSSSANYADIPPPDIPLELDLPPPYWAHEDHELDEDEKN